MRKIALAVAAVLSLSGKTEAQVRRLQRPVMYQSCASGRCYSPPPVTAYPVPAPRVLPSASGPHVVTRAVYYYPVYYRYPRR